MPTPPPTLTLTAHADDLRVAQLAALAVVLSLVDAGIPTPLPGLKPGLANIITLLALTRFGWRVAVSVSLMRILAASLLLGSLFTPGFFLSLTGGLCSLAGLGLAYRLLPRRLFGPVSLSLVAAFCHVAGQLALARLWLIPSDGILYFVPPFALAAWLTGLVNGLVCALLLKNDPLR
ncbi:heptaprenyl diphosphate synthase [Aquaspirillum sp. LM1]|uniref:Gx transporter family protein n=1 Tax=Aquaspirillum sp. LM1 TaxID=1938604 RepID=UPI000983D5C9|nr:Gx transporter family protein [Aquaspirillum sp. LM1]AQR63921.1 heptaprenyl diphosphate synthase [Aquaspirillum sp. LM1]